jgi:hypothetical protein
MQEALTEGKLFINRHYLIALLEISVDVHSVVPQLVIPSLSSYPNYGEEVFTLARNKDLFLMARCGMIQWQQEWIMFRSHCLPVDYNLPDVVMILSFLSIVIASLFMQLSTSPFVQCGAGGPVVNHSSDVVGMSLSRSSGHSTILSISTAISCVNMWTEFEGI